MAGVIVGHGSPSPLMGITLEKFLCFVAKIEQTLMAFGRSRRIGCTKRMVWSFFASNATRKRMELVFDETAVDRINGFGTVCRFFERGNEGREDQVESWPTPRTRPRSDCVKPRNARIQPRFSPLETRPLCFNPAVSLFFFLALFYLERGFKRLATGANISLTVSLLRRCTPK